METKGAHKLDIVIEQSSYLTDTGAANAYVVAFAPSVAAYTAGLRVRFRALNANTGASTLNVNGLGVRSIVKNVSVALVLNDILANQVIECTYDGTNFQMAAGGGGTSGYSGFSGSGISGYSGFSGLSGYSGFSGPSGYSGFSGPSGYSGFSGFSGPSGYSGYSGFSGPSGYSGYSGFSGQSGYSGFSGLSGISGLSGYSGFSGLSGYSGFSGSGISGWSGYSGFSGLSGYSGFSGFSGISGYSGFSGPSGYSGFSGPSGYSGYSGLGAIAYSATFNATASWSGPTGGFYTIAFTHNLNSDNLAVELWDETATPTQVHAAFVERTSVNVTTIKVDEVPNSRFAGRFVINGSASSGYSGFSGLSGYSGYSGFSAVSGYSGFSGTPSYAIINVSTTPYNESGTIGERILLVDASGGAITINLPTAVGNTAKFSIKKIDSSANTVTVDANITETIDNDLTKEILFQNTSFTIVSNNVVWKRVQ